MLTVIIPTNTTSFDIIAIDSARATKPLHLIAPAADESEMRAGGSGPAHCPTLRQGVSMTCCEVASGGPILQRQCPDLDTILLSCESDDMRTLGGRERRRGVGPGKCLESVRVPSLPRGTAHLDVEGVRVGVLGDDLRGEAYPRRGVALQIEPQGAGREARSRLGQLDIAGPQGKEPSQGGLGGGNGVVWEVELRAEGCRGRHPAHVVAQLDPQVGRGR